MLKLVIDTLQMSLNVDAYKYSGALWKSLPSCRLGYQKCSSKFYIKKPWHGLWFLSLLGKLTM